MAVKKVLEQAKYAQANEFATEQIPAKVVWTVEDFITKIPEELLDMLEK